MKIFKSIKWRLQIWYGLILVAVLTGFGFTAIQLERERQMSSLDVDLEQRFAVVANALHPHPPKPGPFPLDQRPPEQMPPRENLNLNKFQLPPRDAALFDSSDPHHFFYTIVSRDGEQMAHSANWPSWDDAWVRQTTKDQWRDLVRTLPSGETVSIECFAGSESQELKMTALKLTTVGGIILIFGLSVGGWLVSRAIRPIEQISSAATKISAGDLSQRINTAETESELGKLAAVLNSTFARLESAFAQQKQFASDAAHELRTPVSVILTQTQTTLTREREAKDYKEAVEACQRAAQRMRKLISSLLELARLDAGQEKLKRLRFDFSKTISDCVELIQPIANEHGIKIISELSPLEISGDSERLAQVVTNLLTNAIQYNKSHGEIRVKLESQNGLAALIIADTGHGISPLDLPHVFKRFYRGDKSRTGASNAGLGLAICKAIVEAHSGTIGVTSEEDVGTTFTIRLPLT